MSTSAVRIRLFLAGPLFSIGLWLGPAVAGEEPGHDPAVAGLDDGAFTIPDFAAPPAFGEARRESGRTVARAEITYRKADGRELGPWYATLYRPAGRDVADPVPGARAGPGVGAQIGSGVGAQIGPGVGAQAVSGARAQIGLGVGPEGSAGLSGGTERLPLVILLPLGGEKSKLDAFFARRFVEGGFAVLALRAIPREADEGVMHSLRGTARTFTEDVANLLRVLRWARALPGIDPGRIGLLGVSRGAIGAAVAAQAERRPGGGPETGVSCVLVLGGADMAALLKGSHLGTAERLRANETARAGGDTEKAAARAASILRNVDPISRPGRLDPARTLLVNARSDRVIPRQSALGLREAAGGATQAWLPFGHNSSILFARKIRRLALDHFIRTLSLPGLR